MIFVFVVSLLVFAGLLGTAYVAYLVRHSRSREPRRRQLRLMVVIGSGGHTTEMLETLSKMGDAYNPRIYVLADTDAMSEQKVIAFESARANGEFTMTRIRRSREVGQSYATAVGTTLLAFLDSLQVVWATSPDVLLVNGPGTCIPVAAAVVLFDVLRLRDTALFYVESWCRVQHLSLSGALLYFSGLADEVFVMWPELVDRYPRALFIGAL